MQDPSAGVQPPLDKHVHLISGHQYPIVGQLNLEQAFRFLIEAPSVVKQVAPMAWTYVSPPQDGTIWLEWLAPAQNGGRFPSDGYVWCDPEQTYRHSFNGYTIELMNHQHGFRPNFDHMTSHSRTRYHFIAKAPHINAAAPDPSLWIVHYHHAQQQRIVPTSQIQPDQITRHILAERHHLERLGRIERREFMLHDREHWPTITVPSTHPQQRQQHAQGQLHNQALMSQHGYSQAPFPQQYGEPPNAKRQRTQGPGGMPGVPEAGSQDNSIEEEEYTALGDYFDHLTPRDISLTRYQQHHQWMEEVFSSPFASANIVPIDLGLGLMGELKGLTNGLFEPAPLDELLEKSTTRPARDGAVFTNISEDQLKKFNERVQKHIDNGKAELERMKADHDAKMRGLHTTSKVMQAERQLRDATWRGHESAVFRQLEDRTNDHDDAVKPAQIEDVIANVEEVLGLKVKTHADATLIEKGGLQKVERSTLEVNSSLEQSKAPSVAASETISFQQDASNGQHVPSTEQKAEPTAAEQTSIDKPQDTTLNPGVPSQSGDLDMPNVNMDIDAGDRGLDLDEAIGLSTPAQGGAADDAVPTSQAQQAITATQPDIVQPSIDSTSAQHASTAAVTNNETNATAQQPGETGLFNDSNFDLDNELGATGDEVGDGLIDFGDDDGMGLDDSAFGDALHGMDS